MTRNVREQGGASVALALGVAGGIFGVVAGLFVMFVASAGMLIAPEGGGAVFGLGSAAVILAIAGGIGAMVTEDSPEVATVVMAVAGVAGFLAATVFWLLPGLLFMVAAAFAWKSRPERRPEPA